MTTTAKFIDHFHPADLVMSTTCFYLGRTTPSVDYHCSSLVAAWPELPAHVQNFIRNQVEMAFTRDDRTRKLAVMSDSAKPLGHDCDRRSWEKVRALWQKGGDA